MSLTRRNILFEDVRGASRSRHGDTQGVGAVTRGKSQERLSPPKNTRDFGDVKLRTLCKWKKVRN